jgi:uncharacterized protein YaaN involved in tellurite resistance
MNIRPEGPQTRLLQNNDSLMIEKIQSSPGQTPSRYGRARWVLALGLEHSRQATAAQREVTNVTNELLRRNAEKLKTGTVETAKEGERSIVDIETLKHTNEQLISTLDEVMAHPAGGRAEARATPRLSSAASRAN